MKKALLLLLVVPALLSAQSVVNQDARNQYKRSRGAASTDSVSTTTKRVKYLVGMTLNMAVANDSIIVRQSTDTLGIFVIGSTAPAAPSYVQFNTKIDSPYVIVSRKKTSDITLIYRDRP